MFVSVRRSGWSSSCSAKSEVELSVLSGIRSGLEVSSMDEKMIRDELGIVVQLLERILGGDLEKIEREVANELEKLVQNVRIGRDLHFLFIQSLLQNRT